MGRGSKRTFTYSLIPEPSDVARVEAQARKVLAWACDGDDRITCHDVNGSALGVVTLSMTIHGRDRWWSTQLAQDVLNIVLWGLRNDVKTRLDLQSRQQEIHMHRGYAHGRTKRHRESASTSTPPFAWDRSESDSSATTRSTTADDSASGSSSSSSSSSGSA